MLYTTTVVYVLVQWLPQAQHSQPIKSHRAETQTECDTKKLDYYITMLPGVQGPKQNQVQGTNAHFLCTEELL